jgi:hypothetical protein
MKRPLARLAGWLLMAVLLGPKVSFGQDQPPLKPEEIDALVAPIALYPDALLSQVLMASTYPLEVVQAARWVQANPNLEGDAAVQAVAKEPWDVSVKSLVAFPQILMPMNEKLDWTQKLGDAFLAQQAAVMEAVQRLRRQAEQAGSLKSNEQQKVVVEQAATPQQTIITIQPANPQVIYVPAYNPTIVYGSWLWPAYPPFYWPPPPRYYPGGYLAAGFAFGVGVAAAGAIFGGFNWRHNDVNININRVTNIDRNYTVNRGGGDRWQHNPAHRKGVPYQSASVRDTYAARVPGADARRDYRGRESAQPLTGARPAASAPTTANRPDKGLPQGGAADRTHDRPAAGATTLPATAGGGGFVGGANTGGGAFQGVGGGAPVQNDYARGRASTASMGTARPTSGAHAPASAPRPAAGGGARPPSGGGRRR